MDRTLVMMLRIVLLGMLALLVSCGSSGELLQVRTYHLREADGGSNGEKFIRGERRKRLHGAVTNAERRERFGQYYTVRWRKVDKEGEAVRIVMEYRQANSGAKIFRKERAFSVRDKRLTEFKVIGAEHREQGRVTSWRVRYYQGEALRDQQRSYLWE